MITYTIAEYRISYDIQFKVGELVTISYRNRDGETRQLSGTISSIEEGSPMTEFDSDMVVFAKVDIDGKEQELHFATIEKPNRVIYYAFQEEPEPEAKAESNLNLFSDPPQFTTMTMPNHQLVSFELTDGTRIIEMNTDGEIFVRGEKIEANEELTKALKEWLANHGYGKGDE